MKGYKLSWDKKKMWAVTVFLLLAAGLFVAALAEPKQQSTVKWVQLNRSVEAVLEQSEQDEQSGLAENENQGTQVRKDTDKDQKQKDKDKDKDKGNEQGQQVEKDGVAATSDEKAAAVNDSIINTNVNTPDLASSTVDDGKLDINRATAEQLDSLKGIGPAKAQAIVDDRNLNGQFSSVGDLQRVKGIGPKLLEGVKDSIVARP